MKNEPSSELSQKRKSSRDLENERIRILFERRKEQILGIKRMLVEGRTREKRMAARRRSSKCRSSENIIEGNERTDEPATDGAKMDGGEMA